MAHSRSNDRDLKIHIDLIRVVPSSSVLKKYSYFDPGSSAKFSENRYAMVLRAKFR